MRLPLRIYAITLGNKILMVYFGTLALARLAVSLASSFVKPPVIATLPHIPVDAFNLLAPNSIGTAFGT
jgi:hypothetical protein